MTKSSFQEFNLWDEIQVCVRCFENLTVPVRVNEAFRTRILELIKEQKIEKKFLQLEHPFSNCKWLESLYRSGRFSDLRLIAETGKVFKVHKIVLAGEYCMNIDDLNNTVLVLQ
jgi:hypothetical protein